MRWAIQQTSYANGDPCQGDYLERKRLYPWAAEPQRFSHPSAAKAETWPTKAQAEAVIAVEGRQDCWSAVEVR